MSCYNCPSWDKELETCNKDIKDLKDQHCFFKNLLWSLSMILDELRFSNADWEEGENWKYPDSDEDLPPKV